MHSSLERIVLDQLAVTNAVTTVRSTTTCPVGHSAHPGMPARAVCYNDGRSLRRELIDSRSPVFIEITCI